MSILNITTNHSSFTRHPTPRQCLIAGRLVIILAIASPVTDAASPATAEAATSHGASAYPRALTANEIPEHFKTNNRLNAIAGSRPFTLMIKNRTVERHCPECRLSTDYGEIRYKEDKSQVCFTWDRASYPEGGCYSLIQTGEATFELRSASSKAVITYDTSGLLSATGSSGQPVRVISAMMEPMQGMALTQKIIFSVERPAADNLHIMTAGQQALRKRGWNTETCDKDCLRGSLVKNGVKHWVEMRVKAPYVEIGYITGTQEGKTGWLNNLKQDVLTILNRS